MTAPTRITGPAVNTSASASGTALYVSILQRSSFLPVQTSVYVRPATHLCTLLNADTKTLCVSNISAVNIL